MSQDLDKTSRLSAAGKLRQAGADLSYLMDHHYEAERAATFVCDHYGLGGDAQALLLTAICGEQTRIARSKHTLDPIQLNGAKALVDTASTLPPIASILSGKAVVLAQDNTLQLASPADKNIDPALTLHAIDVVLDILSKLGATQVELHLDASAPDAARAATTINDYTAAMAPITNPGLSVTCCVTKNPAQTLAGAAALVTQNPVLIAQAASWLSLSHEILQQLPTAHVIDPVFE